MPDASPFFTEIHDGRGNFLGVFINAAAWNAAKDRLNPILQLELERLDPSRKAPERAEPLADLQTLLDYWDFTYPYAYDLACECCGASTEDWSKDEPRKFRLMAANMGGLVNFQCQACRSRVIKRYFKKHASTECRPYVEG